MTWILFSLAAAFSESLKDTFGKLSSIKTNEFAAGIVLHAVSFFLVLPLLLFAGIPELKASFWYGSAAFLFITPAWTILYMKALRLSELSKVIPLMAFNPIFTAVLSFVFEKNPISLAGWTGIGLISIGIYIANANVKMVKKDLLFPLKNLLRDPGALAMLGVALLWSFGAHFSKMRVDGSSPLFSTMTGGLIGIVTTALIAQYSNKKLKFSEFLSHKWALLPVGLFYFLATILSSFALQTGSATYVFAVKRGSIVASLFTGKFFFGEQITINKVSGVFCIAVGICLLMIAG